MDSSEPEPQFYVTSHGYMLEHSILASCRLNLQFYLWKDTLKFVFHPRPSVSLSIDNPDRQLRVAEIGCGTGSWIIDAALQYPQHVFTAFDIDCGQMPPREWLPSNIDQVQTLNIFDEIPDTLAGTYDVVHVRLFILVVENSDPRPVMRNLRKLLRPGGWLQWEEIDVRNHDSKFTHPDNGQHQEAFRELLKVIHSDGRHDWILRFAEILAEEGFVETHQQRFEDSAHMLSANSAMYLMTISEFATRLRGLNKSSEAQKMEDLVAKAWHELRTQNGAYLVPKILALGRRDKIE